MKRFAKRSFFLVTGLFACMIAIQAQMSFCDRTAFMGKCENLALPENFEELQEIYFECLEEYLNTEEMGGFFVLPDSDNETIDQWEKVQAKCKHLKPDFNRKFAPATPEVMVSSLQTWIASILTCDRFHIVNHAYVQAYRENSELAGIPVKEDKSTIPEYYFESTYDCARDPVIREHENQYGEIIEEELYPSTLNIRMYFDGEEKEMVKEWTTSGTMHFWSGLTNRMFKNRDAVMRQDVPITDLLDEFEKKPVFCRVAPEKTSLNEGEETEIIISDFRDARMISSREFQRILVHAAEGEILNGEKSAVGSEYRVFRLNELPIKVKYKAPDKDDISNDRITVYNSCDILPVEKVPLRETSQGDLIATHDLFLTHYDWTGDIHLEITETYTCDDERQAGEISSKRTMADDHKSTVADILIGMTDFDLPAAGNSIDGKMQYLSGQLTMVMREDHTINGMAERTQCHNSGSGRWEWVSPGNWSTRHETWAGQAYRDVNMEEAVLNLLITKKSLSDKSAVDDMQQELARLQSRLQNAISSMDMKAVEQIKGEMQNLAQGGKSTGDIPVKAVIEISFGVRNYPVYTTYERKVYNVCTGEYEENESRSETLEMPILPPFGCQMEGMYIRGENGNDRIDLSINDTKQVYKTFGSGVCPEATVTVKGSIYLERMKK